MKCLEGSQEKNLNPERIPGKNTDTSGGILSRSPAGLLEEYPGRIPNGISREILAGIFGGITGEFPGKNP